MKVIGGLPVRKDGRVHTTLGQDPSTLRFNSKAPNLQNLPRSESEEAGWVKKMFITGDGMTFWRRDFKGIEALLVGWFANSPAYYRLARLDIHSFLTAHALHTIEHTLKLEDLPSLDWSDADLGECLSGIKTRFKRKRTIYKRGVHSWNYMASAYNTQEVLLNELGYLVSLPELTKVRDLYLGELFPEIPKWWETLSLQTHANPCVVTPSGFPKRFYNVRSFEAGPGGWTSTFGPEAKELVAFPPQHTAAYILKLSLKEMWHEHREPVGESLRLPIHDEAFGECSRKDLDTCLEASKTAMERPRTFLPLDPAWEEGDCIVVGTEAAVGRCWGEMEGVEE